MRRVEERRLRKARTSLLAGTRNGAPATECVARHLGPVEGEMLVAVTDDRILWTLLGRSDVFVEMSIDRIVAVELSGWKFRLTERDSRPVWAQRGWLSTTDDLSLAFELPPTDEGTALRSRLERALIRRAPFYAESRARAQELRERQGSPVGSWRSCPFCGDEPTSGVAGAVGCSGCLRCFCDPGLEPVVSKDDQSYGHVTATQPWRPRYPAQMRMSGRTTSWLVRPKDRPIGPDVFPEVDLLEVMDLLL